MSTATLEREAKTQSIDRDLENLTAAAERDYRNAVVKAARGQSLPSSEITAACTAYGRSVAQFQAAVKIVRKRLDAADVLAKAAERQQETDKLYRTAAGIMEEIRALDAEHRAKRQALSNRYVQADTAYQSAANAETARQTQATQILRETAADVSGDIRDPANCKLD